MSYPILVKNIESNYFFVKEEEEAEKRELWRVHQKDRVNCQLLRDNEAKISQRLWTGEHP
jgi:hypothetical protein